MWRCPVTYFGVFSLDAVVVLILYNDIKQWVPEEGHVELGRCVKLSVVLYHLNPCIR